MSAKFTVQQLEKLLKEGKIRSYELTGEQKKKGSKYGNKKTVFDGITFDSQKEANRYMQLRFLLKAGEIKDLRLQVEFELNEGGTHSLKYLADFVYTDKAGNVTVEDVKVFRTNIYKKKRRLMKEVHGIEIKEV